MEKGEEKEWECEEPVSPASESRQDKSDSGEASSDSTEGNSEQIENRAEYKYEKIVTKPKKPKTSAKSEECTKEELVKKKKKKEKNKAGKKERMKDQECAMSLSESDIKSKLIESAKIKSKVSRQSLEDGKKKKKLKRDNNTVLSKEKKRKSSCDVYEDPLLPKKIKSSISKESMVDQNTLSICDTFVNEKLITEEPDIVVTSSKTKEGKVERRPASEAAVIGTEDRAKSGE